MPGITFDQVMSNGTYGMRDQVNAPLELPPSQVVAWGPGSFVSDEYGRKIMDYETNRGNKKLLLER